MKIALKTNSGVEIIHVNTAWFKGSAEDYILKYADKTQEWVLVDDNLKILKERVFRDAWTLKSKNLEIDISKVKEIWLNHYRTARTPLLAALDVDFMRAVESGNTTLQKEIASKKQALRDVTKTELPNTLEEIKATWPEILGKNPFK